MHTNNTKSEVLLKPEVVLNFVRSDLEGFDVLDISGVVFFVSSAQSPSKVMGDDIVKRMIMWRKV